MKSAIARGGGGDKAFAASVPFAHAQIDDISGHPPQARHSPFDISTLSVITAAFAPMPILYTHGSIFHADEVVGAGLLIHLGVVADVGCIRRVNMLPEVVAPGDIVLDIGLRHGLAEDGVLRLDHHQDKSMPCAAVLVYRHFEARWSKPERRAIERFLDGVDRDDRGFAVNQPGTLTLSNIVAALNPVGEADDTARLDAFREAVTLFLGLFRKLVAFQELVESQAETVAALVALNAPVICADTFLPKLLRALEGSPTRFAVYPSLRGGWCLQAVSRPGTKIPVQVIPADTPGATFVHAAGFIASFATRDEAEVAGRELAAIPLPSPEPGPDAEAEIVA